MAKFSEDVEQFREDVVKIAEEMLVAYDSSECDEMLLEELWDAQGEGVQLPINFFKDILDNIGKN